MKFIITNFNLLFLILLSILYSCGERSSKSKETLNQEKVIEKKDNNIKIFFDGFFTNNDKLILTFNDMEGTDSIIKNIKAMPNNWQRIEFEFPQETIPYSFKFSLSKNSPNKIKFDKIVLNRQGNRIIIKDSTLLVYFKLKNFNHHFADDTIVLDKGNEGLVPELISKDNLNSRIINRYSENKL